MASDELSATLSVGPAYVPTVLPTVESNGYSLLGYLRKLLVVRYVEWAVSEQKSTSVISSHDRI